MNLQMSTIIGMGDLAEDEIIQPPIPMDVDLQNIILNIIEDRAPVNITSPGVPPINLAIGRMKVTRDLSGVFHIQPSDMSTEQSPGSLNVTQEDLNWQKKERDREMLSMQLVMQQLKMDNDGLRRSVTSAEKHLEVNR